MGAGLINRSLASWPKTSGIFYFEMNQYVTVTNKRVFAGALLLGLLLLLLMGVPDQATGNGDNDDKKAEAVLPPALVAVSEITSGTAQHMVEFVGTIFYARSAKVASEVEGLVEQVDFEEGDSVKKNQRLVRLGTDILNATIEGTTGEYEQALVELEEAKKNLARMEVLYKEDSISESVYDDHFFKEKSLEKKAAALKGTLDRLLLERQKKTIVAPFKGIVLSKSAEKGEWVSAGGAVAVIADDSEVDVVLDLPEEILARLTPGRVIDVSSGGKEMKARFTSFVPKGDVATRTFAAKFRMKNKARLVEGMEARALVPAAAKRQGLLVPRDAVTSKFGQSVVFVVAESKAKMVPVQVFGYEGLKAGVSGEGLEAGQQVVVDGNERLMDGQAVMVAK